MPMMSSAEPVGNAPAADTIDSKIRDLHDGLRVDLPGVARIAVAVYDQKTDTLKTFAHSTVGGEPLVRHEARLSQVPSLRELAERQRDRVVQDTSMFEAAPTRHSRWLARTWGSSYTRPLFDGNRLRGFVFFDAVDRGYFTQPVVLRLTVYSELIGLLLASSLFPARLLHSAMEIAATVSRERDPETGAHLDRMSRYARLVAIGLADKHGLEDNDIEHILLFAPLHDIGKVAVPDAVLLKPGRLTPDEFEVMKTHVSKGAEIVAQLSKRVSQMHARQRDMLTNIVLRHHEAWDGSGYPDGLKRDAIPLEARIVAVADVFDALTSHRPYKAPWTPEAAYAYLRERSGVTFDPDCVAALERASGAVEEIRRTFADDENSVRLREGYEPEL